MERPDRTKDVFIAGLSIAPGDRRVWLVQQCAGDDALLARVMELFAAHERAGSFLAEPGADVRRAAAATVDGSREKEGETIGAYKLLENIGEGGFGTVWMAEQREPVRRLVALKVLKAGMDSAQVVARFEQERQALALMTHPNIAQVFDAGTTPRGLPFFVMELVKGVPVTDYCLREKLPVRARLDLFVQVCRAVQHAHGKGLIHRDIKPRNVLVATVDGAPVAKVIDFGIAKATAARLTDKTLFTEHRAMVGTLEYMSPEQAQGLLDVDTRSDVYSLGALLYELLTGSTPFDAKELVDAGYAEILRILRDVEPPRPSVRVSGKSGAAWAGGKSGGAVVAAQKDGRELFGVLKGELDWVVMKALEKDRGRRYASADGLAEDVERYLAGDPVRAVPPSIGYRMKKFVRRNKAVVGSSAAILLTVFVAAVVTTMAMQRAASNERSGEMLQRVSLDVAMTARVVDGIADGDPFKMIADSLIADQSAEPGDPEGLYGRLTYMMGGLKQAIINRQEALEAERDAAIVGAYASAVKESLAYATAELPQLGTAALGRCAERLRSWEFSHAQSTLADGRRLLLPKCESWMPSPDGAHCVGWDGAQLVVVRTANWTIEQRIPFTFAKSRIVAYPSAERVVIETEGPYFVVDPTSGSLRPGVDPSCSGTRLSPGKISFDGLRVSLCTDRVIQVHDIDSGERVAVFDREWGDHWLFTYDGRHMIQRRSRVYCPRSRVWRIADGTCLVELQGALTPNPFGPLCLADDGDVIDITTGTVVEFPVLGAATHEYHDATTVVRTAQTSRNRGDLAGAPPLLPAEFRSLVTGAVVAPPEGTRDLSRGWYVDWMSGDRSRVCLPTDEYIDTLPWQDVVESRDGKWLFGMLASTLIATSDRPVGRAPATTRPVLALANVPGAIGPRAMSRSRSKGRVFDEYTGGSVESDAPDADAVVGSQDGARLFVRTGREIAVVDVATSKSIAVLVPNAPGISAIASSADGSIVVACDAAAIHWWNLAVPGESKRIALEAPMVGTPLIAVHRTWLAVASGDTVSLLSSDAGRMVKQRSLNGDAVTVLSFEADGSRLAVATASGRIHVMNVPALGNSAVMIGHSGPIAALAWNPDGDRLFSAGQDGTVRVWQARPAKLLLFKDGAIELLSLSDPEITGKPTCLLFPPDGERLICGYDDGAIRVWDSIPWSERVDRRNAAVRAAEKK